MMRIVWCSFWYTTDLQDFFHCHCQLRAGELNLRPPDRYWGTEVLIGTATGTRSRHTLVSSLIQQGGKSFEGRCKKLNIGWKAEDIWRGFRILNSGDILLWDNRRILGKPIIVLARQAQPTHNELNLLGKHSSCSRATHIKGFSKGKGAEKKNVKNLVFCQTPLGHSPPLPVWQKTKLFTDFFSAPFPKVPMFQCHPLSYLRGMKLNRASPIGIETVENIVFEVIVSWPLKNISYVWSMAFVNWKIRVGITLNGWKMGIFVTIWCGS